MSSQTPALPAILRTRFKSGQLRRTLLRGLTSLLGPTIATAGLILLWWLTSRHSNSILFPTPEQTLHQAKHVISDGELGRNIAASLKRILIGFAIGSLIGTFLGLAIGSSDIMRGLLHGPVQFFRFVPAIAWLSPAIIWFGIGEESKIILIVYTTCFIVAISTIAGCESVNENKLRAARSLGANPLQEFTRVMVPATMSSTLTGMRVAMGNSFMTIVAAEMLAAQSGLGYMIVTARTFLDVPTIFVAIVTLGVLGILADRLFAALIRVSAAKYFPERAIR
jgi:NitT/TauT family transport system permease protein